MAGRQDQNGSNEKGLFGDFSVSTVIASGLAAATSFALSSKIGLAGSIIGVAIGGVASAAASQIYKSLLKASAQRLSDLTPDATTNAAPEEAAAAAVDAEPAADETRVYRPGSLSGRSPIQEVAASGTPIAPASVRYAAHERERRVLRRRATAIAAAFAIAAVLVVAVLYLFFGTELGCGIRATGCNPVMSRAQGINTDLSKVIGLSLSNGLVALSGALLCQYQGYADINMGRGAVVIGLAAVVIGEAVVKHISPNFAVRLTGVLVGAVIYYLVYQVIIFVGFDTDLLKMFSALVVAAFLGVPYVKKQLARKHHVKGGIRHA